MSGQPSLPTRALLCRSGGALLLTAELWLSANAIGDVSLHPEKKEDDIEDERSDSITGVDKETE